MKWIAISGSWRKINKKVEKDVRRVVREIISGGDGIISGGAVNVDFIAIDEAMKLNPDCKKIKVFLPSSLQLLISHYRKKMREGVITKDQAEKVISQLKKVRSINSSSLVENKGNKVLNTETYYTRNSAIIKVADELIVFHVNKSPGTQDTINKAYRKGIPVKVFNYVIK